MKEDRYSVYCYFQRGSCKDVRRHVDLETAVEAFSHCSTDVGAAIGYIARVIVTDHNNVVSLEWNFETGISRKIAVQV